MPDESDFRNFKTIEEYSKTLEGNRYFHDLYLKAVNHPIRREILEIINKKRKIARKDLIMILFQKKIIQDQFIFDYNMEYLIKALCVSIIEDEKNNEIYYEITQGGEIIKFLE